MRGKINYYKTKGGGRYCSTANGVLPSSSAWACVWQHFLRPLPCSSRSMATSPEQCRQYRTRRWAASMPSAAFRAAWKALFPCWKTTAGRTAKRTSSWNGFSLRPRPAMRGCGASAPVWKSWRTSAMSSGCCTARWIPSTRPIPACWKSCRATCAAGMMLQPRSFTMQKSCPAGIICPYRRGRCRIAFIPATPQPKSPFPTVTGHGASVRSAGSPQRTIRQGLSP